jgi:hypothetical protein
MEMERALTRLALIGKSRYKSVMLLMFQCQKGEVLAWM